MFQLSDYTNGVPTTEAELDVYQCGWLLEGLAIALLPPHQVASIYNALLTMMATIIGADRDTLAEALAMRLAARLAEREVDTSCE